MELLEYLGYQIQAEEIERANRVGDKSADKVIYKLTLVFMKTSNFLKNYLSEIC